MKVDVYMPFFIGDFIADTLHLNHEESWAYMLLLCYQWRTGHIPPGEFQQIAKMHGDAWSIAEAKLKRFFKLDEAGCLFNARCDREKDYSLKKKEKAHEKARKAASTRWAGHQAQLRLKNAPSKAQAKPEQCPPSSSTTFPSLRSGEEAAQAAAPPAVGPGPQIVRKGTTEASASHRPTLKIAARRTRSTGPVKGSDKPQQTRQFGECKSMIQKWYAELNDVPVESVPWGTSEDGAVHRMMAAEPNLTMADLNTRLVHRFRAVMICEATPRQRGQVGRKQRITEVVRDLSMFAHGPVNAFGVALHSST